jgi:hypothetical protein
MYRIAGLYWDDLWLNISFIDHISDDLKLRLSSPSYGCIVCVYMERDVMLDGLLVEFLCLGQIFERPGGYRFVPLFEQRKSKRLSFAGYLLSEPHSLWLE